MTNIRNALMQAAGSASGDKVYVEDVFSTHLYTGTGSTLAIDNGIDLSGEGGLVWIKRRSTTRSHGLFDTERGVNQRLYSNYDLASGTNTSSLTAFNSNGFTVGTESDINASSETNVSWTFRKQEGFFDIVTYTGDGNTSKTINHNLGCKPGMIIIKMLTESGYAWRVWHKSVASSNGSNYSLSLNNTTGAANGSSSPGGYWNFTAPTSTQFTVGNYGQVNNNGSSFVAYLFADGDESDAQIFGDDGDEAIIKTGSFTPTGSGTAKQTINLGFEPQWLLLKNSTSSQSGNWWIFDNMRGFIAGEGRGTAYLLADTNGAESAFGAGSINITNQGFEMVNNAFVSSSQTFVYTAIRRGPMKEPSAGTDVFAVDKANTGTMPPIYHSNFPVDLQMEYNSGEDQAYRTKDTYSRLGGFYLEMNTTDAALTSASSYRSRFAYMNGATDGTSTVATKFSYMWRRYPKVFDVVFYSPLLSDPVPRNVHNHNLTVKPELIIVKQTTSVYGTRNWAVGAPDLLGVTSSDTLGLNLDVAEGGTGTYNLFDSTQPTATQFTVGYNTTGVGVFGESYVAFLFASLDGISKVGTYSGTGNDLNVTGLNAAARFVLIKRTDATGDWYVFDTLRGIVNGNEDTFLLNTDDALISGNDYIDPHSSGFTITSSAPAALNASGGTYLYLAFA